MIRSNQNIIKKLNKISGNQERLEAMINDQSRQIENLLLILDKRDETEDIDKDKEKKIRRILSSMKIIILLDYIHFFVNVNYIRS